MTALDDVAHDAIQFAVAAAGRRVILGIAGPPGAGKSTLAEFIVERARAKMGNSWAAYLPMDGYHLSNRQLERLGLEDRKGSPPSFDVHGFTAMLSRVAAESREDVYAPEYDRTLHEPIAGRILVPSEARLIVTEGNYLALDDPAWRKARQYIGCLWYIDTPDSLRDERLVARQIAGGRTEEAAREWVVSNDRPNGELVKQSKPLTDRTITVTSP